MASTVEELLLRIRGDSTEGQKAVQEFADKLKGGLEDPIGSAKALSTEMVEGVAESIGVVGVASVAAAGVLAALGVVAVELTEKAAALGGELNDMSEKTGIAVPRLSALKYAAEVAGGSVDQLANAVFMMQRRMGESPDAFEKGLNRIHLTFADIKGLQPDDQFLRIAQAIRETEDPTQRATAAFDLFGRQGRDLLPVMTKDLEGLVEQAHQLGFAWSEEDAKGAEKLEMQSRSLHLQWQRIWVDVGSIFIPVLSRLREGLQQVISPDWAKDQPETLPQLISHWIGALRGNLDEITPDMKVFKDLQHQATESSQKLMNEGIKPLAISETEAKHIERDLGEQLKDTNKTRKEAEDALKRQQAAFDAYVDSIMKNIVVSEHDHDLAERAIVTGLKGQNVLKDLAIAMGDLQLAGKPFVEQVLEPMPDLSDQAARHMARLKTETLSFGDVIRNVLDDIPRLLESAFTGGGGFAGAMKGLSSSIGASLFGEGGPLGFGAGGMLSGLGNKLTGMFGSAFGLALPGIGGAIGSLIGPAIEGLTHLFGGVSEAEKQGRASVQAFEEQLHSLLSTTQKLEAGNVDWKETTIAVRDAYLATGRSEAEAEAAVKRLWDSSKKGAAEQKAAMEAINAVLNEQKQDEADLQAAIQKYHFSIEELGPAMQKQRLDEQAKQLINDWRLLVASGIDVVTVDQHMASSMQDYLTTAKKTSQEVPIAMQPIIQQMIDQGLLTDENGDKITDMTKLGVTFSETMTQGFQHVVDKLTELIAKFPDMAKAMANVPAVNVPVNLNPHWNAADNRPPDGAQTEVPSFDNRALEIVTKPGLVMTHPGDVVGVPKSGMFGGVTVNVHVAGNVWTERDLAEAVSQHIADTFQLKGGGLPLVR
jgi:hypothetical protein